MKSIENKIIFSFASISFAFVVVTVLTFIQVNKVTTLSKYIQNVLEPSIEANLRMTNAINTSIASTQSWILLKDKRYLTQRQAFNSIIDENYNQLLNLSKSWGDLGQVYRLNNLGDDLEHFKQQQTDIEKETLSDNQRQAIALLEEHNLPLSNRIISSLRRISDPQNWEMERTFRAEEALERSMKSTAIVFLILSFIGSASLGLLLLRAVIFPLQNTIKLAENIANGEYSSQATIFSGEAKLDSALRYMTQQLDEKRLENQLQQEKLKKYNQELKTSNDELSQFSYRTSHDLKAPLVTVRRLASAINEDITDGDYQEASDNAVKISKHVKKLEDLVVDILNLAKAELKVENSELVYVSELIKGIKERLDAVYLENEIDIENHIEDSYVIFASKIRLTQILENLVSNAIKYRDMDKSTQYVKVSATRENRKSILFVEDNGIGIPTELQGRAFDMFQRFHPNVAYGSGLGLYIIKKHVEKLKGQISFCSSEQGTTFAVKIPDEIDNEKMFNNDN